MTKLALTLLSTGVFCFFYACTPSLTKINLDGVGEKITMEKSACPSNCPVFTLTVYDNGIAAYLGEHNTDRTGLYYKKLEKKDFERLLASFRETNLWQFNEVYRSNFMDQQTQTVAITFSDQGSSKKIIGKSSRPEPILSLEHQLDALIRTDGWIARDQGQQQASSEMIVQLRQGTNAGDWVKKYRDNKLEVLENYGSQDDYWLVKFDTQSTSSEQLLRKIRRDEQVVGVELRR